MNDETLKKLVAVIVNNNPGDVKLRIKNYLRVAADKWTNQETIDYLLKTFKNGYDVSRFLAPVRIMKTAANYPELQTVFKSLAPVSQSGEVNKFLGIEWGNVGTTIAGIAGAIIGGSILGNLLFPDSTNQNLPAPPTTQTTQTTTPKTMWQKVKDFYKEHPIIAWTGTAIAGLLLIWGLRKLFSKKKAAIIPGVTPAV